MEFMKLFAKNQEQEKKYHKVTSRSSFLRKVSPVPKRIPIFQENKIYREQDHLDAKERLDRFPLKTDCEINCIKKPHFPCKGIHTTEPKPKRLFLACDRRNSYPAPPVTSPSPSYPANHPWFEPGK